MQPVPDARTSLPACPEGFVPRPRLLADLRRSGGRTVLVCAPSGFGKTALLTQWAHAADAGADVAWAEVDGREQDRSRLWSVVVSALRASPTVPRDSRLHDLDPTSGSPATFLAAVHDALDALPVPITLVLHDIHNVTAPAALEGLTEFVAAPPAGLHLVLCSRLDPPLSLGPLRSAGNLHEIRVDRLRLTREETGSVLNASGLRPTPTQVHEIHACAGGWPAGVRLAGTALRRADDPDAFLERFAADTRPVADFLVGEVLSGLPAADREVLAAVTGGPTPLVEETDAADVLDRLARETGLVARGQEQGTRYRVHPLVQAHLRAEYRLRSTLRGRLDPRRPTARDDPADAIDDALRAADSGLLVELVHESAAMLLVTGQHSLLRRVLVHLGDEAVGQDRWLVHCSALVRLESGDLEGTGADVLRAGRLDPVDPDARSAILQSITELFVGASALDLAAIPDRGRLGQTPLDGPEWAALAMVSASGRALLVDADPARASADLEEALALARRWGFQYLEMQCLTLLGGVAALAGSYPTMTTAAAAAVAAATAGGWQRSPWSVAGGWMLAYGALLRAEPADARRYASDALHQGGAGLHPPFVYALRAVHGAALFDSGQRHLGLEQMRQARHDLGAVSLNDQLAAALAVLEHHAAVELGREDAARAVVEWLSERTAARGEVLLMHAKAELSAGRSRAARADIEAVLDGTVQSVLPHTHVEALLVKAAGGVTGGDVRSARHALETALTSGASLGVIRPFAVAGAETRELMDRHARNSRSAESFVARALAAGRHPEPRTARLDEAEREVLERLPSSLSMEQIAGELHIPSVEAHARIRMVYVKLGASSRRTAVAVARERGLLR